MTTAASARDVRGLLREGTERLAAAGLPTSRQDAEWLLASVCRTERFDLYVEPDRRVSPAGAARYRALIERRAEHEPLQYLLGYEDFRGARLRVTPDVLIPRPETEGLVQWATEILSPMPAPRVADIGAGSGAIACALAAALPHAEVLAVERSLPALAVAADNVRGLGLARQVRLLAGDLLAPLGGLRAALDMVVANPPYLPSAVLDSLPREVARFEPRVALDGGPDGLRVLRRIVAEAPAVLRPDGWLLMEIGEDQAGRLASLMAAGGFTAIASRYDLRGVERYIGGQLAPAAVARESTAPSGGEWC